MHGLWEEWLNTGSDEGSPPEGQRSLRQVESVWSLTSAPQPEWEKAGTKGETQRPVNDCAAIDFLSS